MNLDLNQTITLSPDVISQEVSGETVLLDLESEHYFGLDDIGLRFWQLLAQHENSAEVIQQMNVEYDAPEETLHQDLGKFIVELESAGLLSIVTA